MNINRREFVNGLLIGSAVLLAPRSVRAADARVEVLVGEPIGTIAPEIYGHFIEHLGGVVYDGVWVGEQSKIPNVGGIRAALVEEMKKIKPGVMRWPGGCFADSYNWHDGTGPRAQRPQAETFLTTPPLPNGTRIVVTERTSQPGSPIEHSRTGLV